MSTVSAAPNTETLTKHRREPALEVMSAMRALGYGGEDIRATLKAMGHAVPLEDCLRFVLGPKSTAAPKEANPGSR
jgi:hypothetical protein